jgi:hypothetical protein
MTMLNRSNRMLSANQNRLNLGTRTLATGAGLNIDCSTLRARRNSMRVAHPGQIMHARPRPRILWEVEAVSRPDLAWSKSRESGMVWPLSSSAFYGRFEEKAGSAIGLASKTSRAAKAARLSRGTGRTGLV